MRATFPVVWVQRGSAKRETFFMRSGIASIVVAVISFIDLMGSVYHWGDQLWLRLPVGFGLWVMAASLILATISLFGAQMNSKYPTKDYGKLTLENGTEISVGRMSSTDLQQLHYHVTQILHDRSN